MPRPTPLNEQELKQALAELPGWSVQFGKLHREFKFKDFSEAFAFMTRAALIAEAMNHHPDWSNVWNKVVIELVTHSAGGITSLDVEFARRVSQIAR